MSNIIVFTDLDGTLLDHDNYSWQAASQAINELKRQHIPVILNSSKTFVELQSIARELGISDPLICENGSIVAVNPPQAEQNYAEYSIHHFARPYQEIVKCIDTIRQQQGFNCSGFHDMTVEDIMQHTGLDYEAAYAASQREATEPMLWNDSDENLHKFTLLLEQQGLAITRGGRFYHVMSPVDKGLAVKWLIDHFLQNNTNTSMTTIALGDSENDLAMLQVVDYPVLIKNTHSANFDTSHITNIIKTEKTGPQGWNQVVLELIEQLNEE